MEKKNIFLIGNAHLDPVWQWRWQEGSMEAKSTIRSALDRMKEFPDYKFVCSSASVYRWVEEFDPEMFEEIKARVAEGRFFVVGGWHVQPDCNLPSGEAFARQSLYAQRYFKEKLGVTATVGYNVDSFGHQGMMPQILKKSGMDSYIFMRPGHHEKEMETDLFNWVSPDGSSVLTYRIADGYNSFFESMEALENRLNQVIDYTKADNTDAIPFFYGVGNHGGGPTVRNLELLTEYSKNHPELTIKFADIREFFDYVRESGAEVPEHHDDLQHHAAGCYATVHTIKNGIRRSETELSAAETFNMLSGLLCGKPAKNEELADAWREVCFCHFHDSMDGCSIREVYDDADLMLGSARRTAAVVENNALQTISWNVDTSAKEKGLPVVLFNPNSFDVDELVLLNKGVSVGRGRDEGMTMRILDGAGNEVPCQQVHSTTHECTWRTDTLFKAHVPAMGYAVYYIEKVEAKPVESTVSATPYADVLTANKHEGTILENEFYRIQFEMYTGYITSFVDKRTGKELISGRAAVPTVIDEYYHDTWSHAKTFFTDVMARFGDAEVTVVENGPVRATVKVVSRYNTSSLTQYFSLAAGSDKMAVRAWADWHEKYKMLKIAWPMAVENPKAFYEMPFGVIERPADGEEEPGLMWTAVKGDDAGFALVNNNTYSSSVCGGTIYQTVLRSPIYGDHGGPRTDESEFTDQGRIEFNYELMPVADSWVPVIRAARQLNKPVTNIIETWHDGKLKAQSWSALNVDKDNVILSAVKRSEDGKGLIVRLYEVDGVETPVTVSGELLRVPLKVTFTPYSANTYYLADDADEWKEVLFTEYDI